MKCRLITLGMLFLAYYGSLLAQERAENPIITHMYTADPTARVWEDGRLYLYPSTDVYPARGCDLMDGYHIFSTDDMVTWTDHGEFLHSRDVKWGRPEGGFMWAPDCIYKNGVYYYYFPHPSETEWNNSWKIGVAASDNPTSGFKVQGYIKGLDPLIDPNVFIDDDGKSYFYIGGAQPGHPCKGGKLKENMMEIDGEMKLMEGLEQFHEGPFVFKRNDIYYMIYPDHHREGVVFGNNLHYAVSDHPLGPWKHKGIVLEPTGIETSHGSVVEYKDQWYLFYHNGALSGKGNLRSVCFDKLCFEENGDIKKVIQTGDINKGQFMPALEKGPAPVVAILTSDEKAKEGGDPGEFWIVQLGEPALNLMVKIKIEGTASDGIDYRCFNDTWQVNKTKRFRVYPIDDGILEGDESVQVTLIESDDYLIEESHKSAILTIHDNSLPDVEFVTPYSTGVEANEEVEIAVKLSRSFTDDVNVIYSVQGVVAEQNKDFILNSGKLLIPAGKTEAFIHLKVRDDKEAEGDETVVIRLQKAENANIETRHAHYYTIQNDDGDFTESVVYDRIFGALLGFRAGCSMGAVTEFNWSMQRSESTFGLLDEFKPFVHYGDSWTHPAGATEDGGERHKLICTAIIEKQDRINYQDLKEVWLRDCEIENMNHMTQNYDRVLLLFAKWGVSPADFPITKYGKPEDLGEHIHLTARTFQALPCINAGDPENAITDMNNMGKLYYEDPNDDAFAWGAVYNAAMALALLPGSTVESVIEGALSFATPEIEEELRHVMSITEKYDNPMDRNMWQELTDVYMDPESKYNAFARIEKYPNSSVYENVGFAFALFKATNANVKQSVIIATNRGYDTDCTAASAGALCGSLSGTSTIPDDWIEILDSGIANNLYTNAHFSNKATVDGLYVALQNKVKRMEKEADILKQNSEEAKKLRAYVELMREAGVIE